jgi:Acetyltransferase (GNAT) domain
MRGLARQHAQHEQRTGISLAISDTHTGQALGYVRVSGLDWRHLRGSLGYWVAPIQRRRGLATAAVRLLVPWAFRALGLVRIEAAVAVDVRSSSTWPIDLRRWALSKLVGHSPSRDTWPIPQRPCAGAPTAAPLEPLGMRGLQLGAREPAIRQFRR